MPRVHDCISLFLGSRERYNCLSKEEIGTLYFTCGWMTAGEDIFSEHQRTVEKYGEKSKRVSRALAVLNERSVYE
ncbi:DUF1638 domain-containing protein [Sporomusa acidovorans]|uniref:DUF1638 domain-containing protein n=1 Tax=Sporomusa acidovorans TaxID=112900 RepID=UPI0035A0C6B8